jgi:hypothetical protein
MSHLAVPLSCSELTMNANPLLLNAAPRLPDLLVLICLSRDKQVEGRLPSCHISSKAFLSGQPSAGNLLQILETEKELLP